MKKLNIYKNKENKLQSFKDNRGIISDIFYKKKMEHAALIESKPNITRGNHYHKKTVQYIFILKGSLEYWYKKKKSSERAKKIILKEGDFIETPANEIHAMKIGKTRNKFIVFSKGIRGGLDYEKDTFRVKAGLKNKKN